MGLMNNSRLLSIGQAAAETGYSRRELREMLCLGRLYGIRIDGHWRIARVDLERLRLQAAATSMEVAASPHTDASLRTLLDARDRRIRQLQEENAALALQLEALQAHRTGTAAPHPPRQQALPELPVIAPARAEPDPRADARLNGATPVPRKAADSPSHVAPAHRLVGHLNAMVRRLTRAR